MYRLYCLVQGSLAFELTHLSPFTHNLQNELLDLGVINLRAGPTLRHRKRGDVIEFPVIEEQVHTCGDHRFDQASKALRWRKGLDIDGLLDSRNDFCQTICTDGFTDRLLGIKKLVDIGLGKADGFSQVGDRGFAIAVLAEVFVGRRDNLVSNVVIGWPRALGEDIDG